MLLGEAKSYIGKVCSVRFLDRSGQEHAVSSMVYDATYVPLYGGYFITDTDDIRLDRVVAVEMVVEKSDAGALHCDRVAA
jgi:hypothetical protein